MASVQKLFPDRDLQDIAQFWKKYGYYDVSYDQLLWAIGEHLKYGTVEILEVNGEIVGMGRWNIEESNARILDCIIRPDYRRKNILKLMLFNGWRKFPYVKTLSFERGLKDKRTRRFSMLKFLGVK